MQWKHMHKAVKIVTFTFCLYTGSQMSQMMGRWQTISYSLVLKRKWEPASTDTDYFLQSKTF